MKNLIKITLLTFFALLFTVGASIGQDEGKDKSDKKCGGECCSTMHAEASMDKGSMDHSKMTIIKDMDKNKDGKLFQCPMCSNQISDKAGKCANCGMEMKEVSVKDVEANLGDSKHKMMDHIMMNHSKMNHDSIGESEGLNFTAFDLNKDGKVFQCPMVCTPTVSDVAGDCAVCGMHMKEVSIKDAETNVINHDLK